MKTKTLEITSDAVAKVAQIMETKGARRAAFAVLNGACKRATLAGAGMALSLADLPDLPCVMHAADEIESAFEATGVTHATLADAREIAADAVAELLAEEGWPEMGENE
jgi:hypothetical protein